MRRRAAAMLAPAVLALLIAGCSPGEGDAGAAAGTDESAKSDEPFSDCPVAVEEVGAGDLGSEILITSGVFYPTNDSIRAYDYDEVQDIATPVSMIEPEERFCAERVDEKTSTYADDVSIELTPVQLENGEEVFIEGEIGAPVEASESNSFLTADPEFITDEVRAHAEELESGQSAANESQNTPAKMSVSSSSEQVARCTLYTGGGSPANDANGSITVRYDGDERVLTVPDGKWDTEEPFSDGTTVEATNTVEVTVSTEPGVDITTKDLECSYSGDDGSSVVSGTLK